MTVIGPGGFGMFGGRFDEELNSKIDNLLAGKKSAKDKVEEFVEHDLGLDPSKLPLNPKQARTRANEIMQERGAGSMVWDGNSLGLKQIVFSQQTTTCPNCSGSDFCNARDVDDTQPAENLYCYDCADNGNPAFFTPTYPQTTVGPHDKDKDWGDYERIWKALTPELSYSFRVKMAYYGEAETESISPHFDPDPRKLKTGQTVRLQKHVIDAEDEYVYAKVGGLFSDTDICILPQMTPIEDISVWRVVEVL